MDKEKERLIKEIKARSRTARITSIVMAFLMVVTISFLLYGFDRQTEAEENRMLYEMQRDSVEIYKIKLMECEGTANP